MEYLYALWLKAGLQAAERIMTENPSVLVN